jgi:hypothetical protein
MIFLPVKTKMDFVRRYEEGEFGNRSPTWEGIQEMYDQGDLEHCKKGTLFHIRNRIAAAETWYNVRPEDLFDVYYNDALKKFGKGDLYISQMAPTSRTTFQGELMHGVRGLEIFGTHVKKPMRDALKEKAFTISGYSVKAFLERYCDAVSYDWIQILMQRYPEHVIEFSCYNTTFGTVPNLNTLIWEVRQY